MVVYCIPRRARQVVVTHLGFQSGPRLLCCMPARLFEDSKNIWRLSMRPCECEWLFVLCDCLVMSPVCTTPVPPQIQFCVAAAHMTRIRNHMKASGWLDVPFFFRIRTFCDILYWCRVMTCRNDISNVKRAPWLFEGWETPHEIVTAVGRDGVWHNDQFEFYSCFFFSSSDLHLPC